MANQKRTSLKDLATELGVSIATVSRALRSSPEIGQEMQKKVKELAKRLNYRPNPFAQSLRKEAPRVIGVVVPDLVTHYYSAVLDGIEDKAREAGYSVICANTHESCEDEVRAIDNFINLHVEGIIASLSQNTTDYTHFEEIAKMGIPLVFFGRTCLTDKFSCVIANGDIAAQEATQHLIDTGSRRIAFIGGDRELVKCERVDFDWGVEATKQVLQMENRADAILAFNDTITFAAFTAIKELGFRIPEDVALIGFTDDLHAQYVTPRMSAIEDQAHEMGSVAYDLLQKCISGDHMVYKKIVPQKLVIRGTSDKHEKKV